MRGFVYNVFNWEGLSIMYLIETVIYNEFKWEGLSVMYLIGSVCL